MLFQDQTMGQTTETQTTPQTTEDWIAKLVETKGESFKDPQVIAKSKLEADNFIKSLEGQIKELREDVSRVDYQSKLLEQLQNKAPSTTNGNAVESNNNNGGTKASDTKPEISEDVLKALVDKTLTEREQLNTTKQNAYIVTTELVNKYGTNAKAHVEQKAQELGMSYQRLEALAAESPNAFFTLIGEPKKDLRTFTQGTINTQSVSMQTSVDHDWDYYQNIRRTNKTLYYEPQTQRALVADKMRLGDKFGN